MRLKGTLIEWNDDRGFGFLEPAGGGERTFCHISQFARRSQRPIAGDRLTYELSRDKQGRLRATKIQPIASSKPAPVAQEKTSSAMSPWVAVIGSLLFLAVVSALAFTGRVPILVPPIYLVLSLISILAYALDKSAAMNRRWRTQESTLQILSLFGGWPGAWFAQLAFRHKTKKTSFIITFVFCVGMNLAALIWIIVEPNNLFIGR
jgi:uncharacterized membrane protein YsdA (DUF1294 family)/cold shock CspA family protein